MIDILNGCHGIVDYRSDYKIRIYINRDEEDYPQHWHSDVEIIMPVENGYQAIINDITYDLKEEEIILIPPGELHQLNAPPVGRRIILQFDGSLIYNLNGFESVFHMFRPCTIISPTTKPDVHKELSLLIKNIASEYLSNLPFREASTYSILLRFFTILGRSGISYNEKLLEVKKPKQHEYINLFFEVCSFINEHCTENITIDDIAKIAGFSKYHFARVFKQVMNVSWYDYLINRRILNAEQLLLKPDLSIMQIAMKSGFSSLATFNRVFKAKNHCTPSEYKSLYDVKLISNNSKL